MHRWKNTALALLSSKALMVGSSVWAVGLGELELDSFLNEPLDARIALLDVDDLLPPQVLVQLASEEEFERVGAERTFLLMGLSFQVVIDSEGESYVALSSKELIREPILDFILEVKWPDGRLLRDYTVPLDPPRFDNGVLVPTEGANEALLRNDAPGAGVPSLASVGTTEGQRTAVGTNYRVQPNDTLWKIAQRAQLPGASVQATMLEIQRQNPDAFINNNINLLKAGQVLYLPTEIDVSLSDRDVVTAAIRRQNEDWREGRASTAQAQLKIAADSEAEAGDALSAKRAPDTSEEPAQGAGLTVGNAKLAQLQSQLSQMEEEMAILQAIIDAKDQQLALMRATLSAGIDADAMVSSDQVSSLKPASTSEQRTRGDIGDEIDSVNAALAAASSRVSESTQPSESSDTGAPDSGQLSEPRTPVAELPNPIQPIETPPVASKEVSGSTMPWYQIAGGVGVAALFTALALFLQRRRSQAREQAEREKIEPNASSNSVTDAALSELSIQDSEGGAEALPLTIVDRDSKGNLGDHYVAELSTDDALSEADIYLAYGRVDQAIDLLRNAIEANPEVDFYHLKLLEILRDDERHAEAIDVFDEIQETCSLAAIEQAKALMKDPSGVLDDTEESLAGDQDTQVDSSTDSDSDHNDSLASTSGTGNAAPSSDHVDALFDQLQERQRQQQEQPAAGDVALELEAESFEDTEFDLEDIDDLLNRDNAEADLQASSAALLDELDLSELLDSEQVAVASDSDDNDVSTADEPYAAPNEDAPAAKLDLARAYIDMEDFESARVVLEDVLQVGDEAQRREAQALLTTL